MDHDDRGDRQVRVAIVDDNDDIRLLLRLSFRSDQRFTIVGEGVNGEEAIALAEREQPDLMVLDRQMPVLGGVEALPSIRASSPRTAVVLYTAGSDTGTYQAALSAGAVDVLDKTGDGAIVDRLAEILVGHWVDEAATVEVRVGPVASEAAQAWVANTTCILTAIRAHPEVLPAPVPDDVLDLFDRFLQSWGDLANERAEFSWVARTSPDEIQRLVEYWAAVDRMSDEALATLGCTWSPPEGQPFFKALTTGVLEALEAHADSRALARVLAEQWSQLEATPSSGRG
jgi:DNA-binding NarL/FixJ family response regulator